MLFIFQNLHYNSTWPLFLYIQQHEEVSLNCIVRLQKNSMHLVDQNNSRNGPLNAAQVSEQAILKDVRTRISIAPNKLFISGFSGGARASVFLSCNIKRSMRDYRLWRSFSGHESTFCERPNSFC